VGVDNKDVAMGELLNRNLGMFKGDNWKTHQTGAARAIGPYFLIRLPM
jgi:hypothetical protein